MMNKNFFNILFIFSYALSVKAASSSMAPNDAAELMAKMARVRQALQSSATQTPACMPPESTTCSFEGYCGKLAARGQEVYLYQDSQGRQIPNNAYLFFEQELELCGGDFTPPINDPFIYPQQFISASQAGGPANLKKNQDLFRQSSERAKNIFEDTRATVLGILNSRRNSTNSAQIDDMIARVKTVKFKVTSPNLPANLAEQGCELPNAAYDLETHEIMACPQVINMPEGSLFSIFAHELGHSFDPCSSALDFTKQGAKFPDWMNTFKSQNGPTEMAAIPFKDNPFASVVACLQTPKSINVKIPTKDKLLKDLNNQLNLAEGETQEVRDDGEGGEGDEGSAGSGGGSSNDAYTAQIDDQIDAVKKTYDNLKGCSNMTGTGFLQESFADWVSSQAVGAKVAKLPPGEAKEYAFVSQGAFFSNLCPDLKESSYNKAVAMAPKCPALKIFAAMAEGKESDGSHPETGQRVNRIIYAQPEIKKALACKGGETGEECK